MEEKAEETQQEEQMCFILFRFTQSGSALFQIQSSGNIVPTQLYALAGWLTNEADFQITQERIARLEQQRRNQIAIPRPDLPGDILTAKH
jgi:hypothetical protein